jgi:hypothetical protein
MLSQTFSRLLAADSGVEKETDICRLYVDAVPVAARLK